MSMFAFVSCYYNRWVFGASLNLDKVHHNFNIFIIAGGFVCIYCNRFHSGKERGQTCLLTGQLGAIAHL
jgi:hypothetical protein